MASFNSIANIEPALIGIYTLPVGTDLQLAVHDGHRRWYDNTTGQDSTDSRAHSRVHPLRHTPSRGLS